MLVAREQLTFIKSMIEELKRWGQDAVPASTVQAQYIAIVVMLRSVGHVLKNDCDGTSAESFLKKEWKKWEQYPVFRAFIKPTRDMILKEFGSRLNLRDDGVESVFYGGLNVVRAINFEVDKLRDVHGRKVIPLFDEAVIFWDKCLGEVETFQKSSRQS